MRRPHLLSRPRQALALLMLGGVSLLFLVIARGLPPGPHAGGIAYAGLSPRQRLDIYLPEGKGPFPVVVWVHGGAWRSGGRALRAFSEPLWVLGRGYALVSVGYRFSDEAIFPAQIHDLKAAVRWLRANAATHNLDPARVGVWGFSSGGHLAALLGTAGDVAALDDPSLGNAGVSSRVQAVVAWFPPTDLAALAGQPSPAGCPPEPRVDHGGEGSAAARLLGGLPEAVPEQARLANPIRHVTPDDPPFLIQHGTRDCAVPFQQSQMLHDALVRAIGPQRVTLSLFEAGHDTPPLPWAPFSGGRNRERVLGFLDRYLK